MTETVSESVLPAPPLHADCAGEFRGLLRLAIVLSHPTQYYSPWFRFLASDGRLSVKVFYLWNFGVTPQVDKGFQQSLTWDLPLLSGYEHMFVPNASREPGTHRFGGLHNPGLRRELSDWQPDAVLLFGHGWRTNAALLMRGAPDGAKLLYRGDSHLLGRGGSGLKSAARRLITSRLFKKVDQFLAVGRANADYFRAHGASESRLTFVPHCVDNDRFREQGTPEAGLARRRELGITDDQMVLLFAGKFEDKKRPGDVVEAFRAMSDQRHVLVMAGAGPLEPALKENAAGAPNIRFLPFQNQTSMPSLFAAANIFVLPSMGRQETWGLAVNEAMNCRCAIIVSDHVGCATDLVIDGENGRIIPAGDVLALEQAFRDATSDRSRLVQWQTRSTEIVERYSYSAARDGLIRALQASRVTAGQR
jgi:glycosyltransferase involved in cell wall biosynthesis